MSNQTEDQRAINVLIEAILAEWADKGKILEGGWQAYVATSGLKAAPEIQRREMRKAFMLGAQHLFASVMNILSPDEEPTEQDMKRMSLIHEELEAFRASIAH
jgi:hypothetical protein